MPPGLRWVRWPDWSGNQPGHRGVRIQSAPRVNDLASAGEGAPWMISGKRYLTTRHRLPLNIQGYSRVAQDGRSSEPRCLMSSPTMSLFKLGSELRRIRASSEVTATVLAREIGVSQTKMSAAENARRKLNRQQLDKLIEVLEVPDTKAEELIRLQQDADQPGWWDDYVDVIPDTIGLLVGFESAASWIRRHEESFVPALLQTPDYARAVIAAAAPYLRSGDIPRLIEFRMRRQQRLADSSFRFTVVISEGALRRHVGGRSVMAAQLEHLLALDHAADVEVLVLPDESGEHAAQGQTFAVLSFEEDDPDVVFSESVASSAFLDRHAEVRRHNSAFDDAARKALDLEESRKRIEGIAERMLG